MPTNPLFILNLDGIYFDAIGQAHYPSLVDESLSSNLPLEPALKGPSDEVPGPKGPFDIVVSLDATQTANFVNDSETSGGNSLTLRHINGDPITDPRWQVVRASTGKTCIVSWTVTEQPPTHVLRLDCEIPGVTQPRYLFLAFVEPKETNPRETNVNQLPPLLAAPPFYMNKEAGGLFYTVFKETARSQLAAGYQFELAFRVPRGSQLQVGILIDDSAPDIFAINSGPGTDQVPVRIYINETYHPYLLPTQRPNPKECIFSWLHPAETQDPSGIALAFNLEIEPTSPILLAASKRRRVDPTIIEPPYVPPIPPGPPPTSEHVKGSQ